MAGDEGTHFYIIVEGEVSITKRGTEGELAHRKTGDYFGELSLRTGAPTNASVSAHTACKLVRMDRGAFQRVLGPLDTLLAMRKYTAGGQEVSEMEAGAGEDGGAAASGVPTDHQFEKHPTPLTIGELFVTKGTLGEGAFGKVRRCRVGQKVFALKQMQKADIVSMGQVPPQTATITTTSHHHH